MLNLIFGRQKFGKTSKCLELAKQSVAAGENVIMLVPEQYSFECQRHLLESLGARVSNKIEIHSFTSLCEAICSVVGGVSGHTVDDSTRYILVGRAIANSRDNLKLYHKYANSQSFIKSIMSVITEFKQSAITPNDLIRLADKTESELFENKLRDVATILSSYDALLKNRFLDPLDLIERTVILMQDNSFFASKTVIVDEFKGFTKAQFNLLDKVVAGSKNVYVSLCCDGVVTKGETDIFQNIRKCAEHLIRIADNHGIKCEIFDLPESKKYFSDDINALEEFLSETSSAPFSGDVPNITVCDAATVHDEIDFCFSTIRKMVRQNNMRYRDFVIISRDNTSYPDIVADTSEIYDVPCYVDRRFPVSKLPLSVFVIAALNAALTFETSEILRFVKTGLAGLKTTEISELENYVFIWGIGGAKWNTPWTMSTNGLSTDINQAELDRINSLRERVIEPLRKLKLALKGNVEDMCAALLHLLDDCNTVEHLRNYTASLESNGSFDEAEYQRAGYDAFIKVLDKLTASADNSVIKAEEFVEMLKVALSFETVGEIPQTLDQVIYGTADRIRPMRPKVVFVVGANQDVFPASIEDNGLFSRFERDQMLEFDLSVADRSVSDCLDEKYLFYFSLTSAFEKVYICYSRTSASGAGAEPSAEVNAIIKAFPKMNIVHLNGDFELDDLEVKEAAFRRLAEHYRDKSQKILGMKEYFSKLEGFSDRIKTLDEHLTEKTPSISRSSADVLYGDVVQLSATKVDDFAGCKFMFFCKYGIGAFNLEKVDLNRRIRGNIVHDALEHFIKKNIADIGTLDPDSIKPETDEFCEKYIESRCTDRSSLDEKFEYMNEIVKDTVATLAIAINNEFAQSEFRPLFCELDVGSTNGVDGLDIKTDRGNSITLNGYIDRVDTTPDGKVRIIDYKTGSKGDSFKLAELLNGKNVQMLLYLYTLLQNGQNLIKANIPAGVLYFPAKRVIGDSKAEYVRMNGVVLNDMDTLKQMEPELSGKIIPAHIRSGGKTFYSDEAMLSTNAFAIVFKYVEMLLQNIGSRLMDGDIAPRPLNTKKNSTCDYCDYRSVCRFDASHDFKLATDCNNKAAIDAMTKELEDANNGC